MMLPDFEKAVEGAKAGESKTFDLTFPADYHAKDLAGQTVQFEITVKQVQAPKPAGSRRRICQEHGHRRWRRHQDAR
jgi:FKBP-type peptidyl-prolyl cis-trans isomerase (trigger factor)